MVYTNVSFQVSVVDALEEMLSGSDFRPVAPVLQFADLLLQHRFGCSGTAWPPSRAFHGKVVVMNTSPPPVDGSNPGNVLPTASDVPVPDGFAVDSSFWRFATTEASGLIIGEDAPIVRGLNVVWPTLRKPVVHCEGRR